MLLQGISHGLSVREASLQRLVDWRRGRIRATKPTRGTIWYVILWCRHLHLICVDAREVRKAVRQVANHMLFSCSHVKMSIGSGLFLVLYGRRGKVSHHGGSACTGGA